MALEVFIALQDRVPINLPTFLLKGDLLQGYDLAWRDAIRVNAWAAGIKGKSWLTLDHALSHDRARVRLGPLLGPFFAIEDHGIRQGGRAAVHLRTALIKGLACQAKAVGVGVGVGIPPVVGANSKPPILAEPRWELLFAGRRVVMIR